MSFEETPRYLPSLAGDPDRRPRGILRHSFSDAHDQLGEITQRLSRLAVDLSEAEQGGIGSPSRAVRVANAAAALQVESAALAAVMVSMETLNG